MNNETSLSIAINANFASPLKALLDSLELTRNRLSSIIDRLQA